MGFRIMGCMLTLLAPSLCLAQGLDAQALARVVFPTVLVIEGKRSDTGVGVQGSGVVVSTAGHVLATAHQVIGVGEMKGRFSDGREAALEVLAVEEAREIALLKLADPAPAAARIGDASNFQPGAPLLSVAAPVGLDFSTVSGSVSHPHRTVRGLPVMQVLLNATHGSSGGPVFDANGVLVGLITGELPDSGFTIVTWINNAFPLLRHHGIAVPESPLPEGEEVPLEAAEGVSETQRRAIEVYNKALAAVDPKEKEQAYALATKLLPDFFRAWFNLAVVRTQLEDGPGAEAAYKKAAELEPNEAIVHRNLGLLYLRLNRPQDAVTALRVAATVEPDSAQAHNDLGEALRQAEDHPGAEAAFKNALELNADYPEAHYNLGLVYGKLNRPAEAAQHLERYLALRPQAEDAAQVHTWIEELRKQ